jgi:hypothetical protein
MAYHSIQTAADLVLPVVSRFTSLSGCLEHFKVFPPSTFLPFGRGLLFLAQPKIKALRANL